MEPNKDNGSGSTDLPLRLLYRHSELRRSADLLEDRKAAQKASWRGGTKPLPQEHASAA